MNQIVCPGVVDLAAFAPALHSGSTIGISPWVSQNRKLPLNHPRFNTITASTAPGESRAEIAYEDLLLPATGAPAENLAVSLVGVLLEDGPFAKGHARHNKSAV